MTNPLRSLPDSVLPDASGRVPTPLLIKCGAAFMALWAVTMYLTGAVLLVGATIDTVIHGLGPIGMDGEGFQEAAAVIVFAAVSGPFAWGVWKQRAWTREVAVAFWVGLGLIGVAGMILKPGSDDARALLYFLICAGFAGWYFYRKKNVVRYYDELEARRRWD